MKYPDLTQDWHEQSQTLILLSAPHEDALELYQERLWAMEYRYIGFREPDLSDALTAIAAEPAAAECFRSLPLALRGGEHDER